eukprot:scaffold98661_cov21-Tisochrysis_lutea.AAC.1
MTLYGKAYFLSRSTRMKKEVVPQYSSSACRHKGSSKGFKDHLLRTNNLNMCTRVHAAVSQLSLQAGMRCRPVIMHAMPAFGSACNAMPAY